MAGGRRSFDLGSGFPLVTTKRVPVTTKRDNMKSVVGELLWFLQGSTNVRWLQDQG